MNNPPVYDKIGKGYNTTRRADPYITEKLYGFLAPHQDGYYLDIGCGTGNYLKALSEKGLKFYGIDPSGRMLDQAKHTNPGTTFIQAQAEQLPIEDNFFEGGMGNFTLHHWDDMQQGLNEVYRVIKPGATFIFFSFTPEQVMNYWLAHYFPNTMQNSADVIPSYEDMVTLFRNTGFETIDTEKYFVTNELTDHFLYSNKYRPQNYLNPEIRNGASSFTKYADREEVESGLAALEEDIRSGAIEQIIQQYENELGDYLFYIVQKGK